MKRIILAIKRAALLIKMRALEITLQGQNDSLAAIRDQATRQRIILARSAARRELDRTTSAYITLRRIAIRRQWRLA